MIIAGVVVVAPGPLRMPNSPHVCARETVTRPGVFTPLMR